MPRLIALTATPANMRKFGDWPANVHAFDRSTGEQWSASAGDYFMHKDTDALLQRDNRPMILARTVTTIEPVFPAGA